MAVPTPPIVFVDWGSVADPVSHTADWGSVAAAATILVDWESVEGPGLITSTEQVTKPVDKMWAFLGEMERRKDLING